MSIELKIEIIDEQDIRVIAELMSLIADTGLDIVEQRDQIQEMFKFR